MIHDYKFNTRLDTDVRRRKITRRSMVIAAAILLGSILVVRFADLAEGNAEMERESLAVPADTLAADGSLDARQGPVAASAMDDLGVSALALPALSPADTLEESETTVTSDVETASIDVPNEPQMPIHSLTNALAEDAPKQLTPAVREAPIEPEALWIEHRITKGDTLAAIFKARGFSPTLLHSIVNSSDKAAGLARIRPGQKLRFKLDEENELLELVLEHDRLTSLKIVAIDESFEATEQRKDLERRTATASGTIESSLFVDGQRAGLSDNQIMELAGIFGWDIDFALEIRAGDQFKVVYEDLFINGEHYDTGNILAAEFVNRGTRYQAVRFETADGSVAYFDADGHNKRRAFIRTPVKFARVSSRFTNRRWHPVLKKWRAHKGVDYAAPTGTPVRATGTGRVTFRGTKGGYGRVVMIAHAGKYMTVYGHLSKFASKAKAGSRVKQGQVIGYVGKSGMATGPHLHYEFRVAGVHRNPLRVDLPKSLPLPKKHLTDFRSKAAPLLARLDAIGDSTLVAKLNN